MKYSSLNTKTADSFYISVSDKGINLSKDAEDLTDGQLEICKNVWGQNGRLKNRPGLCADIENVIGKNIVQGAISHSYRLTDTVFFIDGKYTRIATVDIYYSESSYFVYVYLVGDDCSIIDIGNMDFGRVSDDTFYIPDNITFYVGKAQNGGGIFALVSLVNVENFSEKIYRIYEVNADFDGWIVNNNYYTPTVYINGRGNGYEMAKQFNTAYTATPLELEALNLLDGRFYAYYTSDSYSSSFRLPFSQLSDETVICRVYQNSEEYTEWRVTDGNNSVEMDFCGENVKMSVDREKGIVDFFVSGANYAIPQMYRYTENNIRISAKKDIPNAFNNIVSCALSTSVDSKTIFTGGIEGSKIYYTNYHNPLYFPQIIENQIGSPEIEVAAVTVSENRVIAFKEAEIYSIEINGGKPLNQTTLLADNPDIFYGSYNYLIKCISRNVGCSDKSTVACSQSGPIWQSSDGNIYALANNSVYELSEAVEPYIKALSCESGISGASGIWGNHYILCFSSKAVIMEYSKQGLRGNSNGIAWYIWEFPEECNIIGAFSYKGKLTFVCENKDKTVCFAAALEGTEDSVITASNDTLAEKVYDVEAVIKTKSYYPLDLDKTFKIIKVYLQLEAQHDTQIRVASKDAFCDFNLEQIDSYYKQSSILKLVTNLKCTDSVHMTIKTSKPFSLGKVKVYYTETNN